MGQKINPHGFRVGVIKDWDSKWYANKKEFAAFIEEDFRIREYVKKKLYHAGVSRIEIERANNLLRVRISTSKPGIIIGKAGAGTNELKSELNKLTGKEVKIDILEVKNADMDAQLCAENIASQLEKRISFRRAMKQVITRTMRSGAKGIKTACSGRLGGAEIARTEQYHEGTIPLQTLRADIDYGFAEANTTFGKIGVKVWIYKGEVLPALKKETKAEGGNN